MRVRPLVLAALAAASLAPACEPGTVTIAFRPAQGQELAYDVSAESTVTTDVGCDGPARTRTDRIRMAVEQRVLEVEEDVVLVEVALTRRNLGTRRITVRFDRAAQLTEVVLVEDIDADALGELGLSDIFTAAAGAPPEEPLAPGDRWTVDDEVLLPGQSQPTRLTGDGHLVELGVEDGHEVAAVETRTVLPVQATSRATSGTTSLDGTHTSDVDATYDLDDGALRRGRAVTTGVYTLVLGPPPGGGGDPCTGTLRVEVRSEVTRVA